MANIKISELTLVTPASDDEMVVVDATDSASKRITVGSLPDTDTTYSAGDLLDLSTTTFNVDLSELTDGTADVVGSADELVYLDAGKKRKQIDEIKLSQFNNDSSWNNYSHPSGNGNNHIPSDGTSGQFLKYTSAGTAVWAEDNDNNTMGTGFTVSATTDTTATTITQSDDLFFAAGTGITCETTADGTVTIANTVTNTDAKWDGGTTDLAAGTGRTSLGLRIGTDVQAYDSTIMVDADIGTTVQAYDADTAKTDTAQEYTAQQNFSALALVFDATQDWNLSTKQVTSVTLTANTTFDAPTNQKDGGVYVITLIQDGTGSRTAAWNTVFKFAGGTVPTLTTTASAKDILTFVSNGTNMQCIAQVLNVS